MNTLAPQLEFDRTVERVGRQELVTGDCRNVLSKLPEASVDVIVTSPPYNIGINYGAYDDKVPRESYLAWLDHIATLLNRVLKEDGSFFLNIGATSSDPWIAMDVASVFRKHFTLQNMITWVKSISVGEDTIGHFKPINSRRYLNNNHESIFHFTKAGETALDRLAVGVPFMDKSNISRWGHERDKRCAGNVWFIPYKTVRSKAQKFYHPAGFPVELPRRCIQLHGAADPLILDPFVGVGTTLVAAQKLGFHGIGIDVDESYISMARTRLEAGHYA